MQQPVCVRETRCESPLLSSVSSKARAKLPPSSIRYLAQKIQEDRKEERGAGERRAGCGSGPSGGKLLAQMLATLEQPSVCRLGRGRGGCRSARAQCQAPQRCCCTWAYSGAFAAFPWHGPQCFSAGTGDLAGRVPLMPLLSPVPLQGWRCPCPPPCMCLHGSPKQSLVLKPPPAPRSPRHPLAQSSAQMSLHPYGSRALGSHWLCCGVLWPGGFLASYQLAWLLTRPPSSWGEEDTVASHFPQAVQQPLSLALPLGMPGVRDLLGSDWWLWALPGLDCPCLHHQPQLCPPT